MLFYLSNTCLLTYAIDWSSPIFVDAWQVLMNNRKETNLFQLLFTGKEEINKFYNRIGEKCWMPWAKKMQLRNKFLFFDAAI